METTKALIDVDLEEIVVCFYNEYAIYNICAEAREEATRKENYKVSMRHAPKPQGTDAGKIEILHDVWVKNNKFKSHRNEEEKET
jgi:hypothetical protein